MPKIASVGGFLPFLDPLHTIKTFSAAFPTRISHKISHKIFPQDFPKLDPKFPPITALLNMPTYHKSAKVSPPPFPQISWEPQIYE